MHMSYIRVRARAHAHAPVHADRRIQRGEELGWKEGQILETTKTRPWLLNLLIYMKPLTTEDPGVGQCFDSCEARKAPLGKGQHLKHHFQN